VGGGAGSRTRKEECGKNRPPEGGRKQELTSRRVKNDIEGDARQTQEEKAAVSYTESPPFHLFRGGLLKGTSSEEGERARAKSPKGDASESSHVSGRHTSSGRSLRPGGRGESLSCS